MGNWIGTQAQEKQSGPLQKLVPHIVAQTRMPPQPEYLVNINGECDVNAPAFEMRWAGRPGSAAHYFKVVYRSPNLNYIINI